MVDNLCATNIQVVCPDLMILSMASLTLRSDVASNADVASSNANMAGFLRSARANASRWR
jgi:hypothetical protein